MAALTPINRGFIVFSFIGCCQKYLPRPLAVSSSHSPSEASVGAGRRRSFRLIRRHPRVSVWRVSSLLIAGDDDNGRALLDEGCARSPNPCRLSSRQFSSTLA